MNMAFINLMRDFGKAMGPIDFLKFSPDGTLIAVVKYSTIYIVEHNVDNKKDQRIICKIKEHQENRLSSICWGQVEDELVIFSGDIAGCVYKSEVKYSIITTTKSEFVIQCPNEVVQLSFDWNERDKLLISCISFSLLVNYATGDAQPIGRMKFQLDVRMGSCFYLNNHDSTELICCRPENKLWTVTPDTLKKPATQRYKIENVKSLFNAPEFPNTETGEVFYTKLVQFGEAVLRYTNNSVIFLTGFDKKVETMQCSFDIDNIMEITISRNMAFILHGYEKTQITKITFNPYIFIYAKSAKQNWPVLIDRYSISDITILNSFLNEFQTEDLEDESVLTAQIEISVKIEHLIRIQEEAARLKENEIKLKEVERQKQEEEKLRREQEKIEEEKNRKEKERLAIEQKNKKEILPNKKAPFKNSAEGVIIHEQLENTSEEPKALEVDPVSNTKKKQRKKKGRKRFISFADQETENFNFYPVTKNDDSPLSDNEGIPDNLDSDSSETNNLKYSDSGSSDYLSVSPNDIHVKKSGSTKYSFDEDTTNAARILRKYRKPGILFTSYRFRLTGEYHRIKKILIPTLSEWLLKYDKNDKMNTHVIWITELITTCFSFGISRERINDNYHINIIDYPTEEFALKFIEEYIDQLELRQIYTYCNSASWLSCIEYLLLNDDDPLAPQISKCLIETPEKAFDLITHSDNNFGLTLRFLSQLLVILPNEILSYCVSLYPQILPFNIWNEAKDKILYFDYMNLLLTERIECREDRVLIMDLLEKYFERGRSESESGHWIYKAEILKILNGSYSLDMEAVELLLLENKFYPGLAVVYSQYGRVNDAFDIVINTDDADSFVDMVKQFYEEFDIYLWDYILKKFNEVLEKNTNINISFEFIVTSMVETLPSDQVMNLIQIWKKKKGFISKQFQELSPLICSQIIKKKKREIERRKISSEMLVKLDQYLWRKKSLHLGPQFSFMELLELEKNNIGEVPFVTKNEIALEYITPAKQFLEDSQRHWGVKTYLDGTCSRCTLPITENVGQNIIIFKKCGHAFHQFCIPENACAKCMEQSYSLF